MLVGSLFSGYERNLQQFAQDLGGTEQARGTIRVGAGKDQCLSLEACRYVALGADLVTHATGFVGKIDRSPVVATGARLQCQMAQGAEIRAGYGEPQTSIRVAPLQAVAHGCAEVVLLAPHHVMPTILRSLAQLRVAALGYGQVPIAVLLSFGSLLARLAQALESVLAQNLEQLVADFRPMLLRDDKRPVNQLGEQSEHIRARDAVSAANCLGGL
jgi:hypothetical protein